MPSQSQQEIAIITPVTNSQQCNCELDRLAVGSATLAAELFVVQDEIALPWWIAQVRHEAPSLLEHPGGWRRVRSVTVHGPTAQAPAALAQLHPARVEWKADATRWVEVELEGGAPARTVDLRPTLPLVLRR